MPPRADADIVPVWPDQVLDADLWRDRAWGGGETIDERCHSRAVR